MLHQHGGRHRRNDIGIAGLRLTAFARIAAAVILHHIALTGDDFQSPGNQLLSNHLILSAALIADKLCGDTLQSEQTTQYNQRNKLWRI